MTTVFVTPEHDTSMVTSPTETCNGWASYETWNVALWLANDEGLYGLAREYRHRGYVALADTLSEFMMETPDGVNWKSPLIDVDEMDAMLEEL
tara:strand:- start:167 stop:445 length:279 start_codon:yes stop_codon:yes gene_type:complete